MEISDFPPPVELRPLALELVFGPMAEQYIPKFADVSMHLLKCEYPVAMYLIPDDYGYAGWFLQFSDMAMSPSSSARPVK